MARRRVTEGFGLALVALSGGAPLAAQSTTTNTANTANTTAPATPPAGSAVGPPQLRDFTLNGTVTQPTEPAPAPTTSPRPAAPTTTPATESPPASVVPPPRTVRPGATRASGVAPAPAPTPAARDTNPASDAVTVDLPPATASPILPEPSFAPTSDAVPASDLPLAPVQGGASYWPWVGALLAVLLGGGFLWWRRRQQREEEALAAADQAELGALIAAREAAPAPLPRATPPTAPVTPRTSPATTPARAQAVGPAPTPVRTPAPSPTPAAPPAPKPLAGGIVASGLKPRVETELVPLSVATDAAGGAVITFDLIIHNRGSAPARDVLIQARLINAGPKTDEDVGLFFLERPAEADRLPVIAPMGQLTVRVRVAGPADKLAPIVVEGRRLLVPIVAINALYRWSGGELTASSSYLVGRGDASAEKLAPFRLDLGARSWTMLAARLHSTGLLRE
jgi:hypothetical protein